MHMIHQIECDSFCRGQTSSSVRLVAIRPKRQEYLTGMASNSISADQRVAVSITRLIGAGSQVLPALCSLI